MRPLLITSWLVTSVPLSAQMDFTASTAGSRGAAWARVDSYAHISAAKGKSLLWNASVFGYSPDAKTDLVLGNSAYIAAQGKDSYAAVVGAKRILFSRDRFSTALGGLVLSPHAGAQRDGFGFAFAVADYRVRQLRETTFTAGLHRTIGRDPAAGWTRSGTILGFSTPLRRSDSSWQLSFDVQWTSGYHFFGYHVYDLTLRRNDFTFVTGYAASNRPTGNHGPFLSLQYRLR
jgi:hypothetical protein